MRRPTVLTALAYPQFRRVWAAGFVSQLGDWMQIFGRAYLAFQLTGRAETVGLVYFATFLPQLLLSLWGGVLADRFDRKRILVVSQIMQAAGAAVMGLLVVTDTATVANVTALSLVLGIGFTFQIPAMQALTPAIVPREDLSSAISIATATNSVTRVAGPLLAAAIIPLVGVEWVFWANAASFFVLIVAWAMAAIPPPPVVERGGLAALQEGVRFVRSTPTVAVPIGATAFLASVGIVYQPLSIVYATDVLAGGDSDLGVRYNGWLQAAIGVGAAVGILALAEIGRRRPALTFISTAIVFSIALGALGLIDVVGGAVAVLVVLGAAQFANMTLSISIVQHESPEAMRGRVMSIQMLALIGLVPIASLVGGWLADKIGLEQLFLGAGLACLAFSILLLRWRQHFLSTAIEHDDETYAVVSTVLEDEG
ncbi:MAG: MFS transporter [Acidimicrobiia bacterium]